MVLSCVIGANDDLIMLYFSQFSLEVKGKQ